MARTGFKDRRFSRRKTDRKRKNVSTSRTKEGLGFKRLSEFIPDPIQQNATDNDIVSGNKEESRDRKDGNDRVGDKVSGTPTRLEELEKERGKYYGDPFLSHQAIGLIWEGQFRNRYHDINFDASWPKDTSIGNLFPASLVVEMLAGLKIGRLARPTYLQDNVDDAKVYLSFSERFRSKR